MTASAQEKRLLEIPRSIQDEHREIHELLLAGTREPGRVGAASRALAAVLDPHFVREEEIALPPLGLLRRLAAGELADGSAGAMAMADTLRQELPRMLEEHVRIHAAVDDLRTAARAEKSQKYEGLADELALHAATEEEILYPAALLVGEIIHSRVRVRKWRDALERAVPADSCLL
jgi:hypothetical protein